MLTTTVKTHTCKNSGTFQLIQYLSKTTQRPTQPDDIQCQPNQGVQSVEHSQSGNDSSASHSVNYSGKSESAHGVQPVTFTLCCCVHQWNTYTNRERLSLLCGASPHRTPLDSPQLHRLDCSLHCRAVALDLQIREEEGRFNVHRINT